MQLDKSFDSTAVQVAELPKSFDFAQNYADKLENSGRFGLSRGFMLGLDPRRERESQRISKSGNYEDEIHKRHLPTTSNFKTKRQPSPSATSFSIEAFAG